MKNFYNPFLGTILLLSTSAAIRSQPITFEKHYATTFDQSGKDMYQTSDGGYLIAATTENSIMDDLNVILVKTDAYGTIQTIKTYGGSQVDFPNDICPTSDGNFFVVGYSRSFGTGDQNVHLLKVNQSGDLIFEKNYGGWGNEEGKEIIPTADGNYVIIGASNSVASNNDMQLIKINANGDVIWTRYYGTSQYESARCVRLCSDGGFIIAGKTALNPTSPATAMIVRTNSNGDTLWTRRITDGVNSYEGKSIAVNTDGTYTLAIDDSSATNDSDVRVMKLPDAATGAPLFNNSFGGNLKDICKNIRATNDGGYVIGGISRSFGWVNPDMWIVKLDGNGNQSWMRNFGASGHEHLHSIRHTTDGGYIATGHARSFAPQWEIYFLKLDANGLVGIGEFASDSKLAVYPNPSNGIINIDIGSSQEYNTFSISNSLGQVVYAADLRALRGNELLTIDIKDKQPGIYFVTLQSSDKKITKKLILN
jgi:hypothetical protein